jgi:hypothetical protein
MVACKMHFERMELLAYTWLHEECQTTMLLLREERANPDGLALWFHQWPQIRSAVMIPGMTTWSIGTCTVIHSYYTDCA